MKWDFTYRTSDLLKLLDEADNLGYDTLDDEYYNEDDTLNIKQFKILLKTILRNKENEG